MDKYSAEEVRKKSTVRYSVEVAKEQALEKRDEVIEARAVELGSILSVCKRVKLQGAAPN